MVIFIIHIDIDMNIDIHIIINMNIEIIQRIIYYLLSIPYWLFPNTGPGRGRPQRGRGGAWGGGGGWGDINIHIDINMNIDIHIVINMNIEDYKRYYLLIIRYSLYICYSTEPQGLLERI